MSTVPEVDALYIGLTQGKPTWIGKYQLDPGGMWFNARSGYGVIMYESQETALAGAKVVQEQEFAYLAKAKES